MPPHSGKFISYLRVTTQRQGKSGLGLEAQRAAVEAFLNGGNWQLVEEHVEVESGKHDHNRPALKRALDACKVYGATLVIAKLDRLSRDAHFLLGLQKAGVKFVAADMPEANEMVVGIMALVAQAERRMISERTKAALAGGQGAGRQARQSRRASHRGPRPSPERAGLPPCQAGARVRRAAASRAREPRSPVGQRRGQGADRRGIATANGGKWSAGKVIAVRKRLGLSSS